MVRCWIATLLINVTSVNWAMVAQIAASWVVSPVAGFLLAWGGYKIVLNTLVLVPRALAQKRVIQHVPVYFGVTVAFLVGSRLFYFIHFEVHVRR